MSPEEFSAEVIEITDKSAGIDWASFNDAQRASIMTAFQLVSYDLSIIGSLNATKRALFRHALLMTVGVLGALLLNIDSRFIAFACCVLTALHSAYVSFVLWSYCRTAEHTLKGLKSFVDARTSRGEEKE